MTIQTVIQFLEGEYPLALQESYDNCGLQAGDDRVELRGVLVCLDVTEVVLEECIRRNCNLIISHHPLIFGGIQKITAYTPAGRIIMRALQENICIYSMHTNLDNHWKGFNLYSGKKLGLENIRILSPAKGKLRKLVTFCPDEYAEAVRKALFGAGCGHIGNYDSCSYNTGGLGTFRAGEGASPFVGKTDELHREPEVRIETIFPVHIQKIVLSALHQAHPYEEVAYDIYPLENEYSRAGSGIVGQLATPEKPGSFLLRIKQIFSASCIRYSMPSEKPFRTVAFCGGSGHFAIPDAISAKADIMVTADIRYHEFFNPGIAIADIGHYESEQFSKEIIATILIEKFPKFAVLISETDTNPIKYL